MPKKQLCVGVWGYKSGLLWPSCFDREPNFSEARNETERPEYAALTLFCKFCRLELDQGLPQGSTIDRFRIALEKPGRFEVVLTGMITQLSAANAILQNGLVAIVDATVIEDAQSGIRNNNPQFTAVNQQ